jgi:hypothetical protein
MSSMISPSSLRLASQVRLASAASPMITPTIATRSAPRATVGRRLFQSHQSFQAATRRARTQALIVAHRNGCFRSEIGRALKPGNWPEAFSVLEA